MRTKIIKQAANFQWIVMDLYYIKNLDMNKVNNKLYKNNKETKQNRNNIWKKVWLREVYKKFSNLCN